MSTPKNRDIYKIELFYPDLWFMKTGLRLVKMNIAGCEYSFRPYFLSQELRPASQVLIYFSFLRVSSAVFHSKVCNLTKSLT